MRSRWQDLRWQVSQWRRRARDRRYTSARRVSSGWHGVLYELSQHKAALLARLRRPAEGVPFRERWFGRLTERRPHRRWVRLPSLRLPSLRLPSLRLPSLRLPIVRVPSVRLPQVHVRGGQRAVAAVMLTVSGVAIAIVAVAGAVSSGGGSAALRPAVAEVSPTTTPTPAKSTVTPRAVVTSRPTPTSRPVATDRPSPTPSPVATHHVAPASPSQVGSGCGSAERRVQAARRLLRHADALPDVTLVTAGPRDGLLGDADAGKRTVTLYVRSCASESTSQLALVWAYEAGQFVPTSSWGAAKQLAWETLRGAGHLSAVQLTQDVAAVFAYWQTGTTSSWQSTVSPPSSGKLAALVPFLRPS